MIFFSSRVDFSIAYLCPILFPLTTHLTSKIHCPRTCHIISTWRVYIGIQSIFDPQRKRYGEFMLWDATMGRNEAKTGAARGGWYILHGDDTNEFLYKRMENGKLSGCWWANGSWGRLYYVPTVINGTETGCMCACIYSFGKNTTGEGRSENW